MKQSIVSLVVIGLISCVSLSACSRKDSIIYTGFKCAKVAQLLGAQNDAEAAQLKLLPYFSTIQKTWNPQEFSDEMNQKFQDDLQLYKYSVTGGLKIAREVYQSSECQKMYARN